jgi:hypothetical protein
MPEDHVLNVLHFEHLRVTNVKAYGSPDPKEIISLNVS